MLRVVHKIIIQGYLKNADGVYVFFKKSGGLINSLKKKNSLRVKSVNPIEIKCCVSRTLVLVQKQTPQKSNI